MTKQNEPREFNRWLRTRLFPRCSKQCAFVGLVILGLWITGRVLTDQYHWSQFIWWAPPIIMIGSAWGLLLVSAILGKLSLRTGGMILRPILMLGCIGCSVFLVFGVWRMHRAFDIGTPVANTSIRVLHWNQSAYNHKEKGKEIIPPIGADIVLIVNARRNEHRTELIRALEGMAPTEEDHRLYPGVRANMNPEHVSVQGDSLVVSRFPIIRTGTAWLKQSELSEANTRESGKRGWVMFVELDLRNRFENGPATMVVWVVDLPSEPTLWRATSMQSAVNAINEWNGITSIYDGEDRWRSERTEDPFPEPDLIIGDFNTIRGSNSLKILAPSTTDAFAQAGHGRAGSWVPKINNSLLRQVFKLGEWHIDLAMTGYRWRAIGYKLVPPPVGPHDMQILDVSPALRQIKD